MKLLNTNRFYLAGTNKSYIHLATISSGLKEIMCFANTKTSKIYIEEITGGQLSFIEDDSLVEDVVRFLTELKILDMTKSLTPDVFDKKIYNI